MVFHVAPRGCNPQHWQLFPALGEELLRRLGRKELLIRAGRPVALILQSPPQVIGLWSRGKVTQRWASNSGD